MTGQYAGLRTIHHDIDGLTVLGFPCNQFGQQEPGTDDEILEFVTSKYDIDFPMFSKIEVNGDGACDLYKTLTSIDADPVGSGPISWNFEKFIIGRNGEVVARFSPRTKPDDPELMKVLEAELAKK